ncbi:MAG: YqeG family HAD IIIA-type phosphatase [Bacilli bacterium]|nr:YqeG family HAD IIIA-type phosphatase [Bacilli bacterium]
MEKYLPDMYKENIYKINYDKLKEIGIKCLLFDLDNTIVPFREKEPRMETKELFYKLKQKDFKIIIFSNSPKIRLMPFKEELNVEIYGNARKPHRKSFCNVLKKYKFNENEVAIIGDQMLTDIVGGNRVGITTILITPLESKDPFWTIPNRIRERRIMQQLRDKSLFKKGKYYE